MNLLGKILTVLIFVMALVCMGFIVAVYSTHVNWRERVLVDQPGKLSLKSELQNQKTRNEELSDQKDKIEAQLQAEKNAARQALAKLQTENDEQKQQLAGAEEELKQLRESQRQAVAAMEATQATLASLRKEVDTLRTEIRDVQTDRDGRFGEVVALTDDLHQSVNELKRLKSRQVTLAMDLAKAKEVLDKHGLVPEPSRYADIAPRVDGIVLAGTDGDVIEVSLGSDDGLRKGHQLEVFRIQDGTSKYLGRVEVLKTAVDKSACKIIPAFRKGVIQRGDRVASQLD